jgi:molecular chaperone DnaK (HSP70)
VRFIKSILAILVLVFSTVPAPALSPPWQKSKAANQPTRNAAPPPASSQSSANSYQFQPKGPGPHRGDWLRKYGNLPPSQQEQQLKQDPAFRNLSPEKQNQLLDRLREFNSQPQEKKQQILNRMETFEHLTPEQQETARNLFQRYHNLPEDQRTKVSQAYRRLRGMPPEARNQMMNSEEFRNDYSEEQRDLLRGMTDLNLTPGH